MIGTLAVLLLFIMIAGVLIWLICEMMWRNN